MTTITTTRHPAKFYFGITMGFLAFTAMGLATGYTFLDKYFSGIIVRNECISGGKKSTGSQKTLTKEALLW